MPATLRSLLGQEALGLTVIAGGPVDTHPIDDRIVWVHSSDLSDPTPWLEPGQVLLTDGAQFVGADDAFAIDYVRRLTDHGVAGLGFASGIVHKQIPVEVKDACDQLGLLLFEVGPRTPFIGLIRYVADELAADQRSQLQWSLEAQRAVARAALGVDGLGAILLELADRLRTWVALYDSVGHPLRVARLRAVPDDLEGSVEAAVATVLSKGSRAGVQLLDAGGGVSLQTIGQHGQLRGVLAVGVTTPLDPARRDLVASVIGLASIALEQRRNLDVARRQLRTGLFELLLSGVVDVADRTAESLWGQLPQEPVRMTFVVGEVEGQSLLDELELEAVDNGGRLFFAERAGQIVIITATDDLKATQAVLLRHGLGAASSSPVGWDSLARGVSEATYVARAMGGEGSCVLFEQLAEHGFIGLLATASGADVARHYLRGILEQPEPTRSSTLRTLRVWLAHNGAWDPAARELGVHRHTLRQRVENAGRTIGVGLDDFAARAEVWTALQLVG